MFPVVRLDLNAHCCERPDVALAGQDATQGRLAYAKQARELGLADA